MKKVRAKFFIITLLSIVTLMGVTHSSYANDAVSFYDNLFSNNQFTIQTDLGQYYNDDDELLLFVNNALSSYYYYSGTVSYSASPESCNFMNATCKIILYKTTNGENSTTEPLKNYDNIGITIDSNIGSAFPMVNGLTMTINYDEEMLSSEEEKENYINSYLNIFSSSSGTSYCSYYYRDFDSGRKTIFKTCNNNGMTTTLQIKAVESVVFDYAESAYSDEFKKLTTGIMTIKTDSDINKNMLQQYLQHFYDSPYSFGVDGEIKNDKVFIKMSEWNGSTTEVVEKHLVNLVKDENIDIDLFDRVGYGNGMNIKANVPLDQNSYIQNYLNATHYSFSYEDGSREQYFGQKDYDTGALSVQYVKWNNENKVIDTQIHGVSASFVGYDNNVSDIYKNKVGNELVVNADELNEYNIRNRASASGLQLLGCNGDYSECDLALVDYVSRTIEIHKVTIVLDDKVSDAFKEAFGIKADGTIDIISDNEIDGYAYYSFYDDINLRSLNFDCGRFGNECKLTLNEWGNSSKDSKYETHTIVYSLVQSTTRSSIFSSLVKESIDIYPGENSSFWGSISSRNLTKRGDYDSRVEKISCDSQNNKCLVAVLNSDKKLEIHSNVVIVKDGMSDNFKQIVPGNNVVLNSVYIDNANFIRDASQAYFQSKYKADAYLSDYQDGKAKAWLDYIEAHTVDVSFSENNEEYASIVSGAIDRLESSNLSFTIDDLEYINYFYYNYDAPYPTSSNLNSKTIKNTLAEIINNDHIGYYLVETGGGGTRFSLGWGSNIVLYYDGVAYGESGSHLATCLKHVVYIPDETPENTEAFVAAAQKRIDEYFGQDSGISVRFFGELEDPDELLINDIDTSGFDGNSYRIAYKDKEQDVLIVRNSNKMQTGTFNASDVSSNIDVSSDNATYPMDTVVSSEEIDKNDARYKKFLKKLGLSEAQIIDIDLYSTILGHINNFNSVTFDVRIPILDKFKNKTLYAYYISDDGKIEEHPINLGEFFGSFRTNHFSTYIISEKVDDEIIERANSPNTVDGIRVWVIAGGIYSLIGIASVITLKKTKRTK